MDDPAREYVFKQIRDAELELLIQQAASRQLEADLQADTYRDHKDGTTQSLLFQKLPPEIRHQIFSHVVKADLSIHVFPPKGNERHGYRLSLCDESSYDFELGNCRCDDGRYRTNTVRSDFFNNSLFLVSQSVRREALDAFFMVNKFTFTCLYELTRFTSKFKQSSSKIQRLRIFERVDDYALSDYRIKGIQKSRQRMKGLKHLEVHLFISNWSAYETLYEDGLVSQLVHFAFGPPLEMDKREESRKRKYAEYLGNVDLRSSTPTTTERTVCHDQLNETNVGVEHESATSHVNPVDTLCVPAAASIRFPIPPLKSFTPYIRLRSQYISLRMNRESDPKAEYYNSLCTRLGDHLTHVFMDHGRKYHAVEDVKQLMDQPKLKVREDEKELTGVEKRGILFLED